MAESSGGGGYKGGDDASQTSLTAGVTVNSGGIFGSGFPQPPRSQLYPIIAVGIASVAVLAAVWLHRKL